MADSPSPILTLAEITAESLKIDTTELVVVMSEVLANLIRRHREKASFSATYLSIPFSDIRAGFNSSQRRRTESIGIITDEQCWELISAAFSAAPGNGLSCSRLEPDTLKVSW